MSDRILERLKLLGASRHLGFEPEDVIELGETNMREVEVQAADLRQIVQQNKAEHREVFLKAQGKYREAVIAELEKRLAEARDGKRISTFVELEAPQDHTRDYERVERMLQMSVHATVKLTATEFECYVMDRWPWASQFASNTLSYGIRSKYSEYGDQG